MNGALGTVARLPGQEHPGQGDVLELAQVAEVVLGGQALLPRPAERFDRACPARPTPVPSAPRPDAHWGRSRPHTGARPRRAGRARRPDRPGPRVCAPSRRASDTGSAATRRARPAPGCAAGAAWRPADRRARGGARSCPRTCRPCPAGPARPAPPRAAMPARRCASPRARRPCAIRMSARAMAQPKDVGDVPGPRRPAMHSAYAGALSRDPRSSRTRAPGAPAAAARARWSSSGSEVERPPGVAARCRPHRPAPGPGRHGTAAIAPGRRRNSSSSTTTISAGRAGDPVPVAAVASSHRSASRRRASTPSSSPPVSSAPAYGQLSTGLTADQLVGERLEPAEHRGLLPGPAHGRHGQLDQVRRSRRNPRRPARGGSPRPARHCCSYHALARRCRSRHLVGLLVQQTRPQHVGEEVVIAIPVAAVVQRDDEEVAALQRLQHAPCRRPGR